MNSHAADLVIQGIQEQAVRISILDRQNKVTQEIRELAERRVLFALSRFDSRIERVAMVLADVNGPPGGIDKSCAITVKPRRLEDVYVSSGDADVTAAISRAADRADRAVGRLIDRRAQFDRPRQPVIWES